MCAETGDMQHSDSSSIPGHDRGGTRRFAVRCPLCDWSEWRRGRVSVVVDLMNGDLLALPVGNTGPSDWACGNCGHRLDRPGQEARVLDGVAGHGPM